MYELLYTSVSPQGLSESELKIILENARSKNSSLGITGMLIYHDREIMQILEGEEEDVKALYQAISNDSRHRSVEVLYQGTIEHRSFSQWTMAFKLLDPEDVEKLLVEYEELDRGKTPINLIKGSRNRGKMTFMRLRETL